MRKIANILTDKKFTEDNTFYNVVSSVDALIEGLPTLVIGWNFTKSIFPSANIVDWKINDNTYFTFGNREKRSIYNERLIKFRDIAVNQFIKSITYKFFNIITSDKSEKAAFLGKLLKEQCKKIIYRVGEDMVYIFIPDDGTVYGILLTDVDYIGKDKVSFYNMICNGMNVETIDIKDGEKLNMLLQNNFKNCRYVVPCLISESV